MTLLKVLYYCHRVSTQLHLTNNINISVSINITVSFSVSHHEQVKNEVSQFGIKKNALFVCFTSFCKIFRQQLWYFLRR